MSTTKTEDLIEFGQEKKCYFCKKSCTGDDYCYGCQEFVCGICDERGMDLPFESHPIEIHKKKK